MLPGACSSEWPFSRIGRNDIRPGCASTCSVTSSDLNVTARTVTSGAGGSAAPRSSEPCLDELQADLDLAARVRDPASGFRLAHFHRGGERRGAPGHVDPAQLRPSSAVRPDHCRAHRALLCCPSGVRGRDCKQDRPCCSAPSRSGDHCSCARTTRLLTDPIATTRSSQDAEIPDLRLARRDLRGRLLHAGRTAPCRPGGSVQRGTSEGRRLGVRGRPASRVIGHGREILRQDKCR